jgi:hexosaminidase
MDSIACMAKAAEKGDRQQIIAANKIGKSEEEQMKNLIPKINGTVEEREGTFTLPKILTVEPAFPMVLEVFAGRLESLGDYELAVAGEYPSLAFVERLEYPTGAYRLEVEQTQIRIYSRGEQGYSNALVSLYQLLAKGHGVIRCGALYDEPKYERRGFMLDCCRHFFPLEEIKKLLEQCALLKINQFHWHLSEDQGFRIESKRFPKLNEIASYRKLDESDPLVVRGIARAGESYGGFYTQKEIREVVDYAMARQIDVVPEIDLPGHSEAALAAYPEFSCSGEPGEVESKFGIFDRIFCAGKEETYSFLFKLLDEVCDLFPSKYFHLGGDEAPKSQWESCPDCNRVMKEQGFTDYEELQAYFTARLIRHLKEKGKTPVAWNEAAASGNLDESAVLQYWLEEGADYTRAEIAKDRKFILSPVYHFYCDYTYEHVPMKATLLYEPKIQEESIPEKNILGVEAPMWTEYTPFGEDIEKLMYPRIHALAECGWTRERDYEDFTRRLEVFEECAPLNLLVKFAPGESMGR